ncbi:MAG: amidohydrolase family protein [Steroidobacteraceae bacterium]
MNSCGPQAIQAATTGAAAMMRLDKDLGTLESGKLADIIATRDNPLDDVKALRSMCFVMKDGRVAKHVH